MRTIASKIEELLEQVSCVEIGDIIDTTHCNLDPRRALGRIRGKLEKKGQYRIEYTDGAQGVIVAPRSGFKKIGMRAYQDYVDKMTTLSPSDPQINMKKIIHKVNHWIDKEKKMTAHRGKKEVEGQDKQSSFSYRAGWEPDEDGYYSTPDFVGCDIAY